MSKTIDERVVSMQFDNKDFEKNVSTSMSTIEKLKQSLNFKNADKSLNNLSSSAKKVNMSPLQTSVETISSHFSALEVIGVTALANITNSAVNAGKKIVSALTIDPVKSGFQEYETQINSVQTILANTSSKGTTLEEVNSALDELNLYADKTIYNFTEMTKNIGTFTAAGIDLDTSVSAIQGIANLAAVSGSTSQQASTAMYQLSQALATGTVKLMDWNSVVNAGMGGEVFQNALKETSELLGTGAEAAIEAEGSFRESLSTGWLTADVLTETLKKFTESGANEYVAEYTGLSTEAVEAALEAAEAEYGEADAIEQASKALAEKSGKNQSEIQSALEMAKNATDAATKVKTFSQLIDTLKESLQSGYTQSWETIIGDFEEAKSLFTEISDSLGGMIQASSDTRNNILSGALDSKWDSIVDAVNEAGVSTEEFEEKIKEVSKNNGKDLTELIKKYGSLSAVAAQGELSVETITEALNTFKTTTKETTEALEEAKTYTVKTGDNLTKIGKKYNMTWQELYALNKKIIDDPNLIYPDQILALSDAQQKETKYTEKEIYALQDLAKQAEESGTTINELVQSMEKPSGRTLLIDTFRVAITNLGKIINTVGEAFNKVFYGGMSKDDKTNYLSENLYNLIDGIHNFVESLTPTEKQLNALTNVFEGLFTLLKTGLTILKSVFNLGKNILGFLITPALSGISKLAQAILSITTPIGEVLSLFSEIAGAKILEVFEGIASAFESIIESDAVTGAVEVVGNSFENLVKKVQNARDTLSGGNTSSTLVGGLVPAKSSFGKILTPILNTISTVKKKLEETNLLGNIVKSVSNAISGLVDSIMSIKLPTLDQIIDRFSAIFTFMQKTGQSYGPLGVIKALFDYIKLQLSTKLTGFKNSFIWQIPTIFNDAVKAIQGAMSNFSAFLVKIKAPFTDVVSFLTWVYDSITGLFEGYDAQQISNFVQSLMSIALLYSLYKLVMGMADLPGAISGVLDGVKNVLNRFAGKKNWSDQFKDVAVAIGILAASIYAVAQIPATDALTSAGILLGVVVILGVIQAGLSKFTKGFEGFSFGSFAIGIIAFSAAMYLMVKAFKELEGAKITECYEELLTFAVLVGMMTLAATALGMISGKVSASALSLMLLVTALKNLLPVLKEYNNVEFKDVSDGIKALAIALVAIVAVFGILGMLTKNSDILGVGITILAIVVALKLLKGILQDYQSLTMDDSYIAPILTLLVFIMAFAAAGAILGRATAGFKTALGVAVTLISLALSLKILVGTLEKFKNIKFETGVGGLIALGVMLAGIIAFFKLVDPPKGTAAALLSLAATMAVLTILVAIIGNMELKTAILGVAAISVLMLALGKSLNIATGVNAGAVAGILVMTACVAALVVVIRMLAGVGDMTAIAVSAGVVALVILALGYAIKELANLDGGNLAVILLSLAVGLVAFGASMMMMQNVPWQNIVAGIVGIVAVIVVLALTANMLTAGAVGLGVLAVTLVAIGVAMLAAGAATLIFAAALAIIGYALPSIANGMSQLGIGIQNFINYVAGSNNSVQAFANVMSTLGEAAYGIMSSLGKGAIVLGVGALVLGAGLVVAAVGLGLAGIAGLVFAAALKAVGSALVTVSIGITSLGLAVQSFANSFGQAIVSLANAFGESLYTVFYSIGYNIVAGFALGVISGIQAVVTAVVGLGETIKAAFSGDLECHSPSAWSARIAEYVISGFTGIFNSDTSARESSSNLASNIKSGFESAIGGLFGTGEKATSDLQSGIESGSENVNLDAIASAIGVDKAQIESVMSQTGTDGSNALMSGLSSGDFSQLEGLAEEYGYSLDGLTTTASEKGKEANQAYDTAVSSGVSSTTTASASSAANNVSSMLKAINAKQDSFNLAGAKLMRSLSAGFSNNANSLISKAESTVSQVKNTMSSANSSASQTKTQKVSVKVDTTSATKSMSSAASSLSSVIASQTPSIRSAAKSLMTALANGITAKKESIKTAASSVASRVSPGIKLKYNDTKSAGKYLGEGLIKGIESKKSAAYNAGYQLGKRSATGVKNGSEVRSPSKITIWVGENIGQGLIVGLGNMAKAVVKTSVSLGKDAANSVATPMSIVNDLFNNDISTTPTIRPVVDLTDVAAGATSINDLLTMTPSVGVLSQMDAVSSTMNSRQNPMGDVVSAITDLQKMMSNMPSGNTYNLNGITYDDGSNITGAVKSLVRAARIERRV